ncbi:Hypothetical predicted protein [Olea europaea subsp. europaea]|uniref:Uncharacterized protein n=1 Tax=Olea europaea subsp. europaea TaxID=158383 RepID=A0A8S0S468_OLEEU|nr:Hypothetical predicted protein [Olea europaea subsp. europaea]
MPIVVTTSGWRHLAEEESNATLCTHKIETAFLKTSPLPLVRIRGFVKKLGAANFRPPCSPNHNHRLLANTIFIRVASDNKCGY